MSALLKKLVKASSMLHEAIGDDETSDCKLAGRESKFARNLLNRVTDFWNKAMEKGVLQKNDEFESNVAKQVLGEKEGKSFMLTVNNLMSGRSMASVHKIIESRVSGLENAVKELKKKVQEHDERIDKLELFVGLKPAENAAAARTRECAQGKEADGGEVRIKEQPLFLKYMSGRTVEIKVRYLEWDARQLTEAACKQCGEDVRLVYAGKCISDTKYLDVKLADMKLCKGTTVHVMSTAFNRESKTKIYDEDFDQMVEGATEGATEDAEKAEKAEEVDEVEDVEEEEEVEQAKEADEADEDDEDDEADVEGKESYEYLPSVKQPEVGSSSSSYMWVCKVCTFAENNEVAPVCKLCEAEKGTENLAGEDTHNEESSGFMSFAQQEAAFLKRKHSELMQKDEKTALELQKAYSPRKCLRSKKA